jgi:hypothetical protein
VALVLTLALALAQCPWLWLWLTTPSLQEAVAIGSQRPKAVASVLGPPCHHCW